jgi:hypothetical protein
LLKKQSIIFNMKTTAAPPTQSQRILQRISRKGRGWAFTPHDFADLGDPRALGMTLTRLVRDGKIRRISRGLYDSPRDHPILGQVGATVDAVVQAVARNKSLRLLPSPAVAANQLGLSTQVPARIVYHSNGAPAEVKLGKLDIVFRRNSGRNLALAGRASGLVAQALRFLGKDKVAPSDIQLLRRRLDVDALREIAQDIDKVPAWMRPHFRAVTHSDD